MTATELIKLLDKGYHEGEGLIMANWDTANGPTDGSVMAVIVKDGLAHYLAHWVQVRKFSGVLGNQSDMRQYEAVLDELTAAIEDLNDLCMFVKRHMACCLAVAFFEHMRERNIMFSERLLDMWLVCRPEPVLQQLIKCDLGDFFGNYVVEGQRLTTEVCDEVLIRLKGENALLLQDKKATTEVPADSVVAAAPEPEIKK